MAQFAGRAALVTGAASGIGAACALALAGEGATVWCTDLAADGAAETARRVEGAGGSITAIASASGVRPAPGAAAYSSSKAAVRMLARVVAKECLTGGVPVRVNTISPAGVRTPMWSALPLFQGMVAQLGSEDEAYAPLGSTPGSTRFASPRGDRRGRLLSRLRRGCHDHRDRSRDRRWLHALTLTAEYAAVPAA
jgi:NAD(P)-dependent dehydrogenase (short-subunit alcohol dehydrogenase family)